MRFLWVVIIPHEGQNFKGKVSLTPETAIQRRGWFSGDWLDALFQQPNFFPLTTLVMWLCLYWKEQHFVVAQWALWESREHNQHGLKNCWRESGRREPSPQRYKIWIGAKEEGKVFWAGSGSVEREGSRMSPILSLEACGLKRVGIKVRPARTVNCY